MEPRAREAVRDPLATVSLRRMPTQARSRDKVVRALSAAEEILDRDGSAGLTLTAVAQRAGLSAGALHQYLPDRDAIVRALVARYHARIEELADELVRAPLPDDPAAASAAAVDAFVALYRSQAAARGLRGAWGLAGDTDEDRAHKRRMSARVHAMLAAHGLLGADADGERAAHAIFLAADAILHAAFRGDADGDPALLRELKAMLGAYLRSLASGAP